MTVEDRFPKVKALIEGETRDRDALVAVMRGEVPFGHPMRSAEALASALREEGCEISTSTIRTYRRAVRAASKGDTSK